MSAAKLFFFDLDGTLLNSEKKITPATYAALEAWHAAGYFMAISSGRPMVSITQVIRELNLEGFSPYAVAFNGCYIRRYGEETPLLKYTVSIEDMMLVAREAAGLGLYVHYYDDTHIVTPLDGRELQFYTRVVKLPYRVSSPLTDGIEKESCKMICIDLDTTGRQALLADKIREKTGGRLCCLMSNPWYMEIFPSQAGKGAALTALAEILNIGIENTFAAGDEQNDISMLKAAGCGIAPANATAEVKAAADIVCELDNDHDAFAGFILTHCQTGDVSI
ncbi:MAG: Cof-type HAD-IIB family hydrolase [Lachnospiraceae bacterium]|nr:Cof-type HAD-IIB family hydrolase [Lachnospiraceae bacterium]